tara:strand:+ start:78 stop:458 length:381 start_codon:yes stop_codon:yes gene_type:complete
MVELALQPIMGAMAVQVVVHLKMEQVQPIQAVIRYKQISLVLPLTVMRVVMPQMNQEEPGVVVHQRLVKQHQECLKVVMAVLVNSSLLGWLMEPTQVMLLLRVATGATLAGEEVEADIRQAVARQV